ncbi:metalloregulator ArsR/SmtB family transcription factor [Candidatus Viridilinea mediisalina]|uniref:Protein-tyrosine-phosphatase n=1 Tax=Candidatus Viridilinea mediisalina TaxID=2024553 RepID=A0A2A6RPV6_9CHLR|nr:metalloregulator ArsR/SmtB family transcription factor [Candidatus Viridilinea mediisalina]PDW04931.1 protein-tyrosine-phosphatase [Candidatus Viridilinea mediisalina]
MSDSKQSTPNTPALLPEGLKLLADETRWRLILALRQGDYQVGELTTQLGLPQNLVSYHLSALRQGGLVQIHRSDADGRVIYYSLDFAALKDIYRDLGVRLCVPNHVPVARELSGTIVFLCTANSARSQMAEAWLRHLGQGQYIVRSAGTRPQPIHPLTSRVMAEVGVDLGSQYAKGLEALQDLRPDLIITVCDITREACAYWGSEVAQIHWSISDPLAAPEGEQEAMFRAVRDALHLRVEGLLASFSE